jgi:TatD DNase family protein
VTFPTIDTHAHLDDDQFRDDLPQVLKRALAAGVFRVVSIGVTAESSAACIRLAAQQAGVRAAVAIQPNNVAAAGPSDWDKIVDLANQPGVIAVGETGLDRHWHEAPFPLQEEYFTRHLELARTRGLPVVIHCREAEADVVRVLREKFDRYGPIAGVMHSFTGDSATAQTCVEMGLYISFAGMVTFKSAPGLREVARTVLRQRLLVETDSPYLAPVPVRGRRNEPANVVHTVACLAACHGVETEQLAAETVANARRLFGPALD